MSLRGRLTVAGAGAVFVALAIASLVIYFAVRSNLQQQIDASLIQLAEGAGSKWAVENTATAPKLSLGKGAAPGKFGAGGRPQASGPVLGTNDGGSSYVQIIPSLTPRRTGS